MPRAWRDGCALGKVRRRVPPRSPAGPCPATLHPSQQLLCCPACLSVHQSLTQVLSLHPHPTPLDCSPGPPEALELPEWQLLDVPGRLPGGAARCRRHRHLILQAPRAR